MCGATSEQKKEWANQSQFFQTLTDNYKTNYGDQAAILGKLTDKLTPIFEAGPNQHGFSDEERDMLNTQATESTARGYAHAKEALGEETAARGGDTLVPNGADHQLSAELASTAETERANLGQKVKMADYEQGRNNWQYAAQGLGQVAAQYDPNGTASVANTAGKGASDTANEMAQSDMSVWQVVGGALGEIGGAAAKGATGGG